MRKIIFIILLINVSKRINAQTPAEIPQPTFYQLPYDQMRDAIRSRQQQYDIYRQEIESKEAEEYKRIKKCKSDIISQLATYKYVRVPMDGIYTPYAFGDDICDIRKVQVYNKRVIYYVCGDGVIGQVIFSQEISNGSTRIKVKREDNSEEFFIELYFSELFTNYQ